MPILEQFDPPASHDDFEPQEDALRQKFRDAWHDRVFCFFETGVTGSPWNTLNDAPRSRFFNPAVTDTTKPIKLTDFIDWTAFPKRLHLPAQSNEDRWRQGDQGSDNPNHSPGGPRGWQDEYCEWSVERNEDGKITRVTCTAENYEYWETLWSVSPEKVLQLYQRHVSPQVHLEHLFARDPQGQPVLNDNGDPTYEPANRWNSGTSGRQALHLISPPNNLFAELFLAGGASIVRRNDAGQIVEDQDELIGCGDYGNPGRNSDPQIGASVNEVVRSKNAHISIANPVGLYLGNLNTDDFSLPAGAPADADPVKFWIIERGDAIHTLRASYHVPPELGFTVGDMKIENRPIRFGSQIVDKLKVKLWGMFFTADEPILPQACAKIRPQPLLQPVLIAPERLPTILNDTQLLIACNRTPAVANVRCTDPAVTVTIAGVGTQTINDRVFQVVDLRLNGEAQPGFAGLAVAPAGGEFAPPRPCAVKFVAGPAVDLAVSADMVRDRMTRDRRIPLLLKGLA
jgi:hypothetical protein